MPVQINTENVDQPLSMIAYHTDPYPWDSWIQVLSDLTPLAGTCWDKHKSCPVTNSFGISNGSHGCGARVMPGGLRVLQDIVLDPEASQFQLAHGSLFIIFYGFSRKKSWIPDRVGNQNHPMLRQIPDPIPTYTQLTSLAGRSRDKGSPLTMSNSGQIFHRTEILSFVSPTNAWEESWKHCKSNFNPRWVCITWC